MYLVAPLVVDGSHVDGADGAHAEHEEEGQADVDDGGELFDWIHAILKVIYQISVMLNVNYY